MFHIHKTKILKGLIKTASVVRRNSLIVRRIDNDEIN